MKKRCDFSTFFARNWVYFVLWLLAVILVWGIVFTFLNKPKKEESISLFFSVEKADTEAMNADFKTEKTKYLRNLEISAYSSRMEGFDTLLATRGRDADLLILPETYCEPSAMKALFYPMDHEMLKTVFGEEAECGKAECDGTIYGVKIYDKASNSGKAAAYFTFTYHDEGGLKSEGDYYLFFNKKSLHLGELSGSSLDGALSIASIIWNKESE